MAKWPVHNKVLLSLTNLFWPIVVKQYSFICPIKKRNFSKWKHWRQLNKLNYWLWKYQITYWTLSVDWTWCFLIPITHYYLSTPIQGLPNSFSDNNKNISALACGEPLQNFLALIMKHYKYCLTCFQIHAAFQVQNCSQSSHTINEVIWMHKLFEVGKILHFHFQCFK